MKAIVTSKGQVTIPVAIREKVKIFPGSKLDFQVEEDGSLRVSVSNQDITQLKGIVQSKNRKPVSLKAMKTAVRENAKKAMR